MQHFIVKPCVVLVGKTNVGKSTLFNRLTNKRISIAHKTPGATRDCLTRDADFFGNQIVMADSGGIEDIDLGNVFQELVSRRVEDFVAERATLVLFVVSAKDGITQADLAIANMLRRSGKPILLVVNKVDNEDCETSESFSLGFGEPSLVSAAQVLGLNDLRMRILSELGIKVARPHESASPLTLITASDEPEEEGSGGKVNLAVVGKPNSGKSSFVNALLNEDRVMVSELAGTTVDAVDTDLLYKGQEICLVDTAGIRRQKSIHEEVEKMAVARTLCAIDRSSVVIMMVSAKEGITEQDKKIAGIIFEKKRACVLAINKWDEGTPNLTSKDKFLEGVAFHLPFFGYVPRLFLSAKYGRDIFKVVDLALKIAPRFEKSINTSKLNRSLWKAQEAHPPPMFQGRRLKMYFAHQTDTKPPTFAISCSRPDGFHFSYKRYLTNFFRQDLGLGEIPIRLIFNRKSGREEQ